MGIVRPGIPPITDILLEAGVVGPEQVEAALEHQRASGIRIGEALVELGAASEYDIGWALARQLGYTYLDLTLEALDAELVRSFPEPLLRRFLAVPVMRSESALSVAFGDPTDRDALAELEEAAGMPVVPTVAAPSLIRHALDQLAGPRHDARRREGTSPAHPAHRPTVSREGSGAALLAGHVRRALIADAHEIHFLPAADEIRVYHRIGSALVYAGSGPVSLTYLLLARLETLGGPAYDGEQTHARGRAVCPLGDHEALLDVSLLRIETGLAIVLGVRSAGGATPALEDLGIDPVDLACVRGVLDQPAGLVLVSGPSRSGCSTTLASMLGAVPTDARRSVAFERVTGTPLPSPTRLSLGAELVRAAWREIVVGQCADVVAIDDAFTGEHVADLLGTDFSGRLVLATTDWSDSFALIDFLGSRPGGSQILADRLRLVVQQRMACFEPDPGEPESHTARMRPVFEVLVLSEPMREALRAGASGARMRELAGADQHRTLADRIRSHREAGRISAAEAARLAG